TVRSRRVSRARYTSPMPPAPIGETISYGPNRVPEAKAIFSHRWTDYTSAIDGQTYEDRSYASAEHGCDRLVAMRGLIHKQAFEKQAMDSLSTTRRWRRGESKYSGLLKTRNLLKNRHAQNALASKIAPNWKRIWSATVCPFRPFRLWRCL